MASQTALLGCTSGGETDDEPLSQEDAGTEPQGVTPAPEGAPYATLAEWNLFTDSAHQIPNDRMIPYAVNSPLFSDFAAKRRFIYVPEGSTIGYEGTGVWRFPVGAILVKTFSYVDDMRDPGAGERLLETRLLVHQASGWRPLTYVWNVEQTEATRRVAGGTLSTSFIDAAGQAVANNYVVPNENECLECHGQIPDTLGGRTRQLNRENDYGAGAENQIDHLAALGLFDPAPDAPEARQTLTDPFGTAGIDERVRAYFDANCGHCHNPGDSSDSGSGLLLDYDSTDPSVRTPGTIGICKIPTSAGGATCGLTFDIVPGDPDASILNCRVSSPDRTVQMPPLGRNLVHTEAVALIRDWITGLSGACQ